eukprot:794553-Pyramimonas_sp.AAC.1
MPIPQACNICGSLQSILSSAHGNSFFECLLQQHVEYNAKGQDSSWHYLRAQISEGLPREHCVSGVLCSFPGNEASVS